MKKLIKELERLNKIKEPSMAEQYRIEVLYEKIYS